jgi:hypothetical protein
MDHVLAPDLRKFQGSTGPRRGALAVERWCEPSWLPRRLEELSTISTKKRGGDPQQRLSIFGAARGKTDGEGRQAWWWR